MTAAGRPASGPWLDYEQRFFDWADAHRVTRQQWRYPRPPAGGDSCAYRFTPVNPRARVVIVHGAGNDALFAFVGLFKQLLERDFEVFSFDLDGHGRFSSTKLTDNITSAVAAAIEQARSERAEMPLHLLGVSFGGSLVLHAMANIGTPVVSGIALSAPLHVEFSGRNALAELHPSLLATIVRQIPHVGLTGLIPSFGPFRRKRFPLRLDPPVRGSFAYVERLNRILADLDLLERARCIQVPLLLVHGGSDRVVPLKQARAIAGAVSHSQLLLIEDARHLSTPLAKQAIAGTLDFLDPAGQR